jgi:hypothetical protein
MSRKARIFAALSAAVLVLASCGGGDSSGRTRNVALCYIDQAEKDAAVQRAQEAFDAAMSGAPAEETPEETPTTISEESPTTIEEDVPVITDDSSPELEETFGGGYRRPAVRAASSGDTTVPPAEDGGEVVLTPEQQQAQMDLEAAEAQSLCEADTESTSEVTCTATITIESVTDDCADGDVIVDEFEAGVYLLIGDAETVLARGTFDMNALSADNPIVVEISYAPTADEGEEESSTNNCSAIFTTTGVSWNCPNGELVTSSFDDNFDDNSSLVKSCSSEGFWNTAEGQEFYFSLFHRADKERFLAGLNTEFQLNTEIPFTVPEDTEGICTEIDVEEIDWDSLPFSGQSDAQLQIETYSFTVKDGFEGSVMVRFESSDEFDVDMSASDDFESEPCEGSDCTEFVGTSKWDLEPGDYKFNIDGNSEVVMWTANVEISAAPSDFPTLPFTYSTDGSEQTFALVLEESQLVTLTATSGQTCAVFEDNKKGNGFADPELDLEGPGVDEFDDNSGRGVGNCSAALISEELEPGTYIVTVKDDDGEGFAVVLGSSVELQLLSINWDLETIDVTVSTAFDFDVPAGGAWFRAEVFTNQLETYTYSDPELGTQIDSGGCANPDGDYSTTDNNCVRPNLVVLGESEEEEYESRSDEYPEVTQVDGNWLQSYINSWGQSLEIFFPEGTYTLLAWDPESKGEFTLKYGFASLSLSDAIEIDVKPIDNPEIPTSSSSAGLSTNAMTSDGRISTAIASSVDELVCDTACIDDLFAKAGITEGSIAISAGNETVTVKKGQRGVLIPIDKNADKISVTATSADGTQVVNLSSQIDQLSATEQSAFESMTSASPNDSGFNLLYLLLLIPVLGAVFFVIRRKQTVSISK